MRTVGTELKAKVGSYIRDMKTAGIATRGLGGELDKTADKAAMADKSLHSMAGAARESGRATDAAADDMTRAARAAALLDHEIDKTTDSLRDLAIAQALTGDKALTKQIREQESALRRLSKNRRLFGELGEGGGDDAALGFAARFSQRLGPLLASAPLSGPLSTAMAGAGAAAAPVLVGALSAGISAGIGGGVLGVGLMAVAKDPEVAEAGKQMGARFARGVQERAVTAFEGPVLQSLDKLEAVSDRTVARLGDAFDTLAPHVGPLVDDLAKAADVLGGSLTDAAKTSGPALDAVGDSVVMLSHGVSSVIDTLSAGGPEAASNLRLIAGATSDVVTQTGNFLGVLNKISSNAWFTGPLLPLLKKHYDDAAGAGRRAGSGSFAAASGITAAAKAAGSATGPAVSFTDAMLDAESQMADVERAAYGDRSALVSLSRTMQAQLNPVMGLIEAQRQFKEAQDKANEAVRKHGARSKEARAADLDLASAALNLTGKAGALGDKFNGHLTPAMKDVFRNAGLTKSQIRNVEKSFDDARRAGEKFDKNYKASVSITGNNPVSDRLWALGEIQRGLKAGNLSASRNSYLHNVAQGRLAEGGPVPGFSPHKKADNVLIAATAGEFMQPVDAVDYYGTGFMKAVQQRRIPKDAAAQIAAYADGGLINMPYPVTAARTRVPSVREAEAAVIPAVPAGGQTYKWIEAAARALVGAVRVISDFRPGAHTLSGNLSYHAMGRAVDFAPSMNLARRWNVTYGRRTREEITPWRQYDIWNGRAHHYSAAIHRQHSGGNAHVHIAMGRGGVIDEPIVGVGASGTTYSFGENYQREIVTPQASMSGGGVGGIVIENVELHNHGVIGSQLEVDNWLVSSIDRLRYRVRV